MHGRIPRLLAPLAAILALVFSAGHPLAMGDDTPALRSISSRLDGAVSTVLIEATEPVAYLTSQPDPLTVLVDLRNVTANTLGAPAMDTVAPVSAVSVEKATAPDGAPVARVRLSLDRAVNPRVRAARNTIVVELPTNGSPSKSATTPKAPMPVAPRATLSSTGAAAPVERRAATTLRAVRYAQTDGGYAITISGNGPLTATRVEEAKDMPPRVLLDFADVTMGSAVAVTTVKSDAIERVRVATNSREPLITRVVIDLAKKLPYKVEQIGEDVRVLFAHAVKTAAAAVAPAAAPRPATPARPAVVREDVPVVTREDAPARAVVNVTTPPPLPAPQASQPVVAAAAVPLTVTPPAPTTAAAAVALAQSATPNPITQTTNGQGQRQFTGDPVTLDFQGADLRAVLRTFAEISNGLNIVIDPSIQGTVDVSLHDVPWDQALDIILRANKLGYSVEGNIVRIVPLTVLAQENEERRKLTDAQALAGDLRTMTVAVSYAKAQDLVPVITRSALSSRGDVQVDTRTNTLIIRDLADRVASAADLVRTLDKPQPQVEIEARIVQLTRAAARQLGIQWGFGGQVAPAFGTSTGLAFPSRGNLQLATPPTNIANANTAQLAMGSLNGALNLNVTLQALERDGKGRILSTPRVATQNNVEAEITQGSQIPIQVISNNTVTVTFKDAALTLRVTPQITAANTVIMKIFVEKAAPNYDKVTNSQPIPSIDTQRAVTSVLMDDGETTVIGGIYTRQESSSESRTPFLSRMPLLGWLFRSEVKADDSQELLIFITPRIAK